MDIEYGTGETTRRSSEQAGRTEPSRLYFRYAEIQLMPVGTQSDSQSEIDPPEAPEISVCQSCPGTAVFLESGNTDGWIASDTTIENVR